MSFVRTRFTGAVHTARHFSRKEYHTEALQHVLSRTRRNETFSCGPSLLSDSMLITTACPGQLRWTHTFIPRKAAVKLTETSRKFFKNILGNPPRPDVVGLMLKYDQSSTGEPRMVFSFDFVNQEDLGRKYNGAEGVSLEVDEDGNPKSPRDAWDDGFPKLYVHPDAFLKVLGATVDVDMEKLKPVIYDKDGFVMDPNA